MVAARSVSAVLSTRLGSGPSRALQPMDTVVGRLVGSALSHCYG